MSGRWIAAALGLGSLLAAAPLAAGSAAGAASPEPGHAFSVLSYNVHGLFRLMAKDAPARRSPTIGWLANRYDVVLLQEDFEYHGRIVAQLENRRIYRGNRMRPDPRLVAVKLLLFPFQLVIPGFSPPYGAGLTTGVTAALVDTPEVVRERYATCHGWGAHNADCWATKGFLRVRIRLPGGAEVDVYNTHLDAGPGLRAAETRRRQLAELAAAAERLSDDRAILVAGDFNCALDRPGDWDVMMDFRDRLALGDAGAGPALPFWRERDYILYRSGAGVTLSVEDSGEALEFVNGTRALSDHPALFARFRAVQTD